MSTINLVLLVVSIAMIFFTMGLHAAFLFLTIRHTKTRKVYLMKYAPGLRREAMMVDGEIVWPLKPSPADRSLEATNKFHADLLYVIASNNYTVAYNTSITRPVIQLPCCKLEY